jgi:hypothetical protein
MIRDIVMIVSVMVSVASLGFGFYKNIEASNARGFAFEQAYRILGLVQESDISEAAKASILSSALDTFGEPDPVIDLSRSRADVGDDPGQCTPAESLTCASLGEQLGLENAACERSNEPTGPVCAQAARTRARILQDDCWRCFTP